VARPRALPAFAGHLSDLQYNFRKLADTGAGESQVLILRFGRPPRPSVRGRGAGYIEFRRH